jgi:hypothetical protein
MATHHERIAFSAASVNSESVSLLDASDFSDFMFDSFAARGQINAGRVERFD